MNLTETAEGAEEIRLVGRSMRAFTPPFPGKLSFPLELPENAELVFSAALLSARRVPRARVDFRVELSFEDGAVEVYRPAAAGW